MFLSVLVVLSSVLFLCLFVYEFSQRKPRTNPPLPPLIGATEILMKKSDTVASLFNRLKSKYGPVFRLRVPFYADAVFMVGGDMSKIYHMLKEEEASFKYGYQVSIINFINK